MRSSCDPTRVHAMPETCRRISLEIDEKQPPLHGRVAEANGTSHEFEGWLGLLTVLGSLLDDPVADAQALSPSTNPR